MKKKQYSTLEYILLGLVPYTKANLQLTFKPGLFFNELERISNAKRSSLQSTLSRAQKQGLVERKNGVPKLTRRGFERIQPYTAKKLKYQAALMVIFDIPEDLADRRRKFRDYLKQLDFSQVQKSVWVSSLDYREELIAAVAELKLGQFVQVFECARLFPKPH